MVMGIMAEWYVGNNSDETMIPVQGKVWDEGSRKGQCQDGAAGTESASSVSLGPPSWEFWEERVWPKIQGIMGGGHWGLWS